jgi:hypothetical protein
MVTYFQIGSNHDYMPGRFNMLKGSKMSDESKERCRIAQTGKKRSPEAIAKTAGFNRGKKHSEETKRKMSAAAMGKPKSELHRLHMSESNLGKPHHTVESKRKISEALKLRVRKPHTKETILKMKVSHGRGINNARFGYSHTYESRLKIVEGNVGGFWYGNVRYYGKQQYCERFNDSLRERVRAFFNYKCGKCGMEQNGRKLDVHHINYNKHMCCDNSPRLFVPMCNSCHAEIGKRNPYWIEYFTTMITEKYDGKCYYTIDEMKEQLLTGGF